MKKCILILFAFIGMNAVYGEGVRPVIEETKATSAKLSPLNMGFVRVNADGVNIRKSPNVKAPRLGYFYCSECEDTDYENPQLWEDDPEGQKPFTPFHPEKGTIYPYPKNKTTVDGWQPLVDGQYISAKFVDEIPHEPFSVNSFIDESDIRMIKQGKYAGLCIYMTEDGMDEGFLHFGKIDDAGIIQFYGICGVPHHNSNIKGFQWIDDGFYYGSDYEKPYDWGYGPLDLSKLTTKDLDLLMSKVRPIEYFKMILVGFPDGKQFFFI